MEDTKIIIYQSEDGKTKIQTQLENETLWLSQENMSELFQKSRSTINEHIKNIYKENELVETETMKKFGNSEFAKKPTNYYNYELYKQNSKNTISKVEEDFIKVIENQTKRFRYEL